MTDNDLDEERDPLLVRPYLRDIPGTDAGDPSPQTWPAVPEARRHQSPDGADDPTAVLTRPVKPAWPVRRRVLVLGGVGGVVLLAAAGFDTLRAGLMPAGPLALPDDPLPAVTGPQSIPPSAGSSAAAPGVVPVPPPARPGDPVPTPTTAGSLALPTAVPTGSAASPTTAAGTTAILPSSQAGLVAPEPPAGHTGPIRGQNGLCLDLAGGVATDNNRVLMGGCNGSTTQTWTLATDGTLQVSGRCALVAGDATVHIAGCDGAGSAYWQASGQTLINAADDRCLTDPSGGSRLGTAVLVSACGGSAKQRWSLP